MSELCARSLAIGYNKHAIMRNIDIALESQERVGIYGPSGIGKSTFLRTLAGLVEPITGQVLLNGEAVSTRRGALSSKIAMVFQSSRRATCLSMKLGDIIAEPFVVASMRPNNKHVRNERVAAALDEVGLPHEIATRFPAEVSDGQLQRVALARSLLQRPEFLILDEATSMLDAITTVTIGETVLRVAREHNIGVLMVSHDISLLESVCTRVHDIRTLGVVTNAETISKSRSERLFSQFWRTNTDLASKTSR